MSLNTRVHLFAALTATLTSAQTFQGQISGVVHDMSGAVVPKVQLTAVDSNSGAKYNALTNDAGVYRFPALAPSQYKISASLPGFKTFSEGPITIQVNQNYDLEITLEPGAVTETVMVSAEAPPLETANSGPGGDHAQHRLSSTQYPRPVRAGRPDAGSDLRLQLRQRRRQRRGPQLLQ